jgi:hypothetical protein
MSKFVVQVSVEIDTDKIVENFKRRGVVTADGDINGINAMEYLKGYLSGAVCTEADTTNLLKEVIDDLDKKLGTKDLFKLH